MLFVIDVGNTNTVYGIYDGDTLLGTWRMTTQHSTTSDEIGLFFLKILEYEKIDPAKITATSASFAARTARSTASSFHSSRSAGKASSYTTPSGAHSSALLTRVELMWEEPPP